MRSRRRSRGRRRCNLLRARRSAREYCFSSSSGSMPSRSRFRLCGRCSPPRVESSPGRTFARSRQSGYRAWRLKRFYTRAVARLEGDWAGAGDSGEEFDSPGHLYARDLNVFGEGSLFELLSICRTGVGRHGLAGFLLNPAPVEELLARQQTVRELRDLPELREEIALLGSLDVRNRAPKPSCAGWRKRRLHFRRGSAARFSSPRQLQQARSRPGWWDCFPGSRRRSCWRRSRSSTPRPGSSCARGSTAQSCRSACWPRKPA